MKVPGGMAARDWRSRGGAVARYVIALTAMNLVWEFAQMPLYTLWATGTTGEVVYASLHCTAGDALIGGATLLGALLLVGPAPWPRAGRRRVLFVTVSLGVAYTVFSEWLNVEVRGSWGYSQFMPVVPILGTGLAPLLQWLTLPIAAYLWAISILPVERDTRERASYSDGAPASLSTLGKAWVIPKPPGNSRMTRWQRSGRPQYWGPSTQNAAIAKSISEESVGW